MLPSEYIKTFIIYSPPFSDSSPSETPDSSSSSDPEALSTLMDSPESGLVPEDP